MIKTRDTRTSVVTTLSLTRAYVYPLLDSELISCFFIANPARVTKPRGDPLSDGISPEVVGCNGATSFIGAIMPALPWRPGV